MSKPSRVLSLKSERRTPPQPAPLRLGEAPRPKHAQNPVLRRKLINARTEE